MSSPRKGFLATLNDEQMAKAKRKARRQGITIARAAFALYGKKQGVSRG